MFIGKTMFMMMGFCASSTTTTMSHVAESAFCFRLKIFYFYRGSQEIPVAW